LVFYWFIPFGNFEFISEFQTSNFSLGNYSENMQFYPNMRFPFKDISYTIKNCPLQKKNDMERAFEILSEETILDFYESEFGEISVTCDSKNRLEGSLFIAGEGGPTNVTQAGNFYVIFQGRILLIRESNCERPNVAIHELLHVLGFDHSSNPNNIMYPVSNCKQIIGEDIPQFINEIYLIESLPDLALENAHASLQGKYLDLNFSVRNNGLVKSKPAKIILYADGENFKEISLEELEIGSGKVIILRNIWIPKIIFEELEIFIDYNFVELEKNNNRIKLKIKK